MDISGLNIWAILVAALIEVVIGAVWFNAPFAFNRQWLAGIGKTAEEVAADASPTSLVAAVVGALITAVCLAIIIQGMGITSLVGGLGIGLLAAIGFSANAAFIKDRFEGRPIGLTLVNGAHDIVIFALMGILLAVWQ
ncbi:MAG: DUF1761 domain-containing protein [Chloroflexota bacterium]